MTEMFGLLLSVMLLAGSDPSGTRPRILTPERDVAMSRVRPEPGFTSTAGTHCRRGEQVIYSCDLSGQRRVSVCRDDGTVLYRFGPKGRPEIELGRSTPPVTGRLRNRDGSEFRLRFASDPFSYSVYDGSIQGRPESGVLVWRNGEPLAQYRCRSHGPLQRLRESRVQDMEDDTDPLYDAW